MSKTHTATLSNAAAFATTAQDKATAASLAFADGLKTVTGQAQEFVAFSKANADAMTQAGKIWAAGVQDLTKQVAGSAKAAFDQSVATAKALGAVKSMREAIDLQKAYAETLFGNAITDSNKLTEGSFKLAEAVMAPLAARAAVTAGSFGKAA